VKLGIISDVHADLPMLEAALPRICELGCDLVVCAGDVVDGDSFPDEVIARLAKDQIQTIRGNHDRWALEAHGRRRVDPRAEAHSVVYEPNAGGTLGSGYELSRASLRWLARLPTGLALELEGVRVAVHHARPGTFGTDMVGIDPRTTSPAQLETLRELAGADVLLVGHTHERFALRTPRGLVVNPGALWAGPADGGWRAGVYGPGSPSFGTFGVLDLPARAFRVYRVADGELVLDGGELNSGRAS